MTLKYQKIKDDIRDQIIEGTFKPGEKIYSEAELKAMYDVSSTTVVKSLNDLVQEGLLIRKQGQGTFVRRNVTHKNVFMSEKLNFDKNDLKTEYTDSYFFDDLNSEFNQFFDETINIEDYNLIMQIAYVNNTPWKIQNRFIKKSNLTENFKEKVLKGDSISKLLQLPENMSNYPSEIAIEVQQRLEADHLIVDLMPEEVKSRVIGKNISWLKVTSEIKTFEDEFLVLQINYFDSNKYKIILESPVI